jgi:tetratricopeptide (TPR) repeat protein/CHAT domain-containing protein
VLPLAAQQGRWEELNEQVNTLYGQGKYTEAIPVAQEALRVAEATLGPEHPDVARSLNNLARLYDAQGKYAEAEPLFQQALRILEKALGPDHPYVAALLNNLAGLYDTQGKYSEADPLHERALRILERAPNHPAVAVSLSSLGAVYWAQGKYAEAELLFQRALRIREKALGPDHPDVAISLNNLAVLYDTQGKYAEVEPLLQRALRIKEKALGPEHPAVATSLDNLAGLYGEQGKYAEAAPLYQRALRIREKALGPEHPDVAASLNNLAGLYGEQGKYAEVEPLLQRALRIKEKALGPDHPSVATSLNNLAGLYRDQGKYAEAEPLYKRALAINEKVLGPEHPTVATALNNLAGLYRAQGKYAEGEPLHRRALAIWEKTLGPNHSLTGTGFSNLGISYYAMGRPHEAAPYFARAQENLASQFEQHFTYMSEKERLGFLDTVSHRFPAFFSFCLTYREQNPQLVGKMYDVALWRKGFIAQSVAAVRAQIEAGGDKEALALLDQLTAKKTQLARLLTSEPKDREQWKRQVAELEEAANEQERELVRRSTALAEQKALARVGWRDVQGTLKPGEAAVELLRFGFFDGKKWTDKTYYVALIVTPETTTTPTLVVLGEAKDLEGAPLGAYRRGVALAPEVVGRGEKKEAEPQAAPASFYDAFWKPLEPALSGVKHIYLSLDGVLNQVSLGVVPDPDGRLLIERYELRVVNSTKDLLRQRRPSATKAAVLIGNPAFDLEEATQRAAVRSFQKGESPVAASQVGVVRGSPSRELRGGPLKRLPATQKELEEINGLLRKQQWGVEIYSDQQALEESIKRVRKPRVLHIATHGFFQPDQKRTYTDLRSERPSGLEDPMLRSGLFFAGANRTLAGQPAAPDLEDGILTAYEVTGLNLQGTELVVLSACETGLGQVAAGEGVFGLRRALQVAGAEAVLMSMWSVPDRETQELMTGFYAKWLGGKEKHAALREAQLELRETVRARYGEDLPYYWGAFVLVGP